MAYARGWGLVCAGIMCVTLTACSSQSIKSNYDDDDSSNDSKTKTSVSTNKKTNKNNNRTVIKRPNSQKRVSYSPHQTIPKTEGMPQLSTQELNLIANKIFQNEGGGNYNNLVHWNDGEDFASMGIGHFTWYPAGRPARFGNTFPELLTYMQNNGVQLPDWLAQSPSQGAPWSSKSELMYAKQTGQVEELQSLLAQTRLLQAQYIVERARRAMPQLVQAAPGESKNRIAQNLNAVANTPGGWYALVDYINFKGEGLNYNGGYNGQNWGLLQVLEDMEPCANGPQALHEFANAATRILERRVRNSPPARNEARWMAGWSNRVNTYRNPGV